MKVKIGDKIVNAEDEPILLIFEDEQEKITLSHHLINMPKEATKYCIFPNRMTAEEAHKFMAI